MHYYRNSNRDPREQIARHNTTCPESGLRIYQGDVALWVPSERRMYHMDSDTARGWRLSMMDECYLGIGCC